MITSHRTFGLLCAASFLIAGTFFPASQAWATENQERYANERISIQHARLAGSGQAKVVAKRQSKVAQAAAGRVLDGPPQAPLDGSLVKGQVGQASHLDAHSNCGPICDCANCGAEPVCGIGEPVCGIGEPVCGIGEPVCGIEVGCGIGAAIERYELNVGPGCGVEGCTDCFESVCGVEEIYVDGAGCGVETIGDCSCDACSGHSVTHVPFCLPLLRVSWCRFDFFAGVQGYKGPLNFANTSATNANIRSGSGSFGFYQGFNEGRSLKRWFGWDLATQFGLRATQSNLSGAEFTNETRHQVFLTGGLFRRVDCGLQYGLVFDYLNDDWYFQGDSIQLRGELSWRHSICHTWGLQFMAGLRDDTSTTTVDDGTGNVITSQIAFEPTDQYRLFYRRLMKHSGQWSTFIGWTDRDDGILGADMSLPLRRRLVLSTAATYLIPREGSSSGGNEEEGWNISLGLVYRPGGPTGCGRYCRPMFDVADNGTFMIDRK